MRGIRWGREQRARSAAGGRSTVKVGVALAMALPVGLAAVAGPAAAAQSAPATPRPEAAQQQHQASVDGVPAAGGAAIVRALPGRLAAAEQAVRLAGGTVTPHPRSIQHLAGPP